MKNSVIKSDLKTLLKRYSKSEVLSNIERNYGNQTVKKIDPFFIKQSKYLNLKKYNAEQISLAKKNVLSGNYEPLVVREIQQDQYEVIIGRSNLQAAKELKIPFVYCIVNQLNDEETLLINLTHLRDLKNSNIVEEAILCYHLKKEFEYKNKDLGEYLNLSSAQISNMLQILDLDKSIIALILEGKISYGHAKAFSRLDKESINKVVEKIINEKLNVRETEYYVRTLQNEEEEIKGLVVSKNKITLSFKDEKDKEIALKRIKRLIDFKRIKL